MTDFKTALKFLFKMQKSIFTDGNTTQSFLFVSVASLMSRTPNPQHASNDSPHPPVLSYLPRHEISAWDIYLQQIERVTPFLGNLSRWVETLRRPKRVLTVDVPIHMDDGSIAHFEGFRVQHNTSRGPGKGGVRFHQDVTLPEVMALPAWMSVKCCAQSTFWWRQRRCASRSAVFV